MLISQAYQRIASLRRGSDGLRLGCEAGRPIQRAAKCERQRSTRSLGMGRLLEAGWLQLADRSAASCQSNSPLLPLFQHLAAQYEPRPRPVQPGPAPSRSPTSSSESVHLGGLLKVREATVRVRTQLLTPLDCQGSTFFRVAISHRGSLAPGQGAERDQEPRPGFGRGNFRGTR